MTTPAGVPNLPVEALTVSTLADQLQNQTSAAARGRAAQRIPSIFNSSTGGSIASDLTPFGVIGKIWAEVNSLIATANPDDIQGPEDIPALLIHFIEDLPVVGQFVKLLEAFTGQYNGTDQILLTIQDLFGPLVKLANNLVELLTGAPGSIDDLKTWSESLPLIGPLIAVLTGDATGPSDLGALGAWAQSLLQRTSDIPAERLVGQISHSAFAQIPVANISVATPNLLSQGEFESLATIAPGNGWTYDENENHSGKGGSAKVTANGTLRELFSNQTIKVGEGDKLTVSTWIKTSGYTGSGTPIELSLVPFAGTTQQSTVPIASRTSSTDWVQMTNASPYVILAGVTSVRVRLAVTATATEGSVWFDDIALTKGGLLGQNLVDYLLDAWNKIWDGAFGLTGTPTTGKIWSDMKEALGWPLHQAGVADGKAVTALGLGSDNTTSTATLLSSLLAGYTVLTKQNSETWTPPAGISEMYVVLFGAGTNGAAGAAYSGTGFSGLVVSGGAGGAAGAVIAVQLDPTSLPSTVSITIGSPSSPTTSFGSIVSTAAAYAAYVSTPLGLLPTAAAPTSGGAGGSYNNGTRTNGSAAATTTAGVSGGSAGTTANATFNNATGTTGGAGGAGINFGLCQTGGAGGGGGGGAQQNSISYIATGGKGGAGAFPGGGGGGGGFAAHLASGLATAGAGGSSGMGLALLIYKIAKTA